MKTQAQKSTSPPNGVVIQRRCSCGQHAAGGECTECRKKKQLLQRQESGPSPAIPPIVHDVLRSPGHPLDSATRSYMEPRFRESFSSVRVHTDAKAAESARAVHALAYTVGQNVVFDNGCYAPTSPKGRQLLAHELTHVVQQRGNVAEPAAQRSLTVAPSSGEAEAEAETISRHVVSGDAVQQPTRSSGPAVQREEAPGSPEKKEKVTLSSGLQLDKEIYTYMLNLCNEGKLDPLKCAEMRLMHEQQAPKSPFGLPPLGPSSQFGPLFKPTIPSPFSFNPALLAPPAKGLGPSPLPASKGPAFGPSPLPAAPGAGSSGLGDLLKFNFSVGPGKFSVELPKSVTAKLPLELTRGKELTLELKAESSGTFSFGIALDGLSRVRVSLSASTKIDKDKGPIGSAGLEIQLNKKVCSAANPETLKKTIAAAGEKLKKAYDEYSAAQDFARIEKLADMAGAIGEMYEAVESSKAACKPTPAATFKFGVQGPLSPDPAHPAPTTIGPSLTIPF